MTFEFFRFWTGAINAPYEEECSLELVDGSDEVVASQSGDPSVIAVTRPPNERAREGLRLIAGVDLPSDRGLDDLSARFACRVSPS